MDIKDVIIDLYSNISKATKSSIEVASFNKKAWDKQYKCNNLLLAITCVCVSHVIYSEIKRAEQDRKIESLTEEIEGLKETKGE